MASLQHCLVHTPRSQLMQEIVLKIAQEIFPLVPQPTFLLHEGLMDVVGLWPLSLLLAMEQIHPVPQYLHPVPPRRSCISYPTNQHLMNYTFCQNISALKASPLKTDAGTLQCAPVLEVSALDVLPPAVTMK